MRAAHRRTISKLPQTLVFLGLAVIAVAMATLWLQTQSDDVPSDLTPQPSTTTDTLVARLQRRIEVTPQDPDIHVQLGGAYLQKARETGLTSHYSRAEISLLKALELDPRSVGAMSQLGTLALAKHQFEEGLTWAEGALAIDPEHAEAYGVLGDAQIELGQYDGAFRSFQTMVDLKPNLDSYSRVSYARELTGDIEGAIEAMELAVASGPIRGETTAWARVQLGKLNFSSGNIGKAEASYLRALKDFSGYHLALASLGDLRAAQGRHDEAIDLYERAVAIFSEPTMLVILGDLYTKVVKLDQAQLDYNTVQATVQLEATMGVVYDRELALFYADHDIQLDKALDLARKTLEVRKDIFGYDALAWTLYKNGHFAEAAATMAEALRLGTQDASLFYHAAMIHLKLGNRDEAKDLLDRALALNPHFSVLYADHASEVRTQLVGEAAQNNAPTRAAQ